MNTTTARERRAHRRALRATVDRLAALCTA